MKQKNKILAIAKVFLLLLTLVLPWTIQERVFADTGRGSISINLKDLDSPKADVKFKAYEVGEWNGTTGSWELAECLKDTEISLNDLVYASEWDEAALVLSKQTADLETLVSVSGTTDANGNLTFSDVEWGMYLVVQDGESEYGIVTPFLATIPYMEDGVQKTSLTVQPKAEPLVAEGDGRIEVTKRVGIYDSELLEVVDIILLDDVSYYVGIFKDSKGQVPFGTDYIREIPMKGLEQGKAVFENLPEGTYYIFETDKDGNAYPMNEKQFEDENIWACKLDEGTKSQEVTIDGKADSEVGTVGLYNLYYDFKGDYNWSGKIIISKQIKNGDQVIDVPETFYAGIFSDKEGKNLCSVEKLKNNGTIEIVVEIYSEGDVEALSYYVYETDKDGKLIDKDTFGYTVSGEGKADLRNGNWTTKISLVNTKKIEPTVTPTSSVTPTDNNTDKTTAVRTGDDTPITEYLVIMLAAMLILIVGMVYWRGYKKHE